MTIAEVGSVAAIAISAFSAWLAYRGSDRASARTTEAQREANASSGFLMLTQEQRTEMSALRARAHEAEESARNATRSAEDAQAIAERCQMQQQRLIQGYRELWEWAQQDCPHLDPPPQPPIRIWA